MRNTIALYGLAEGFRAELRNRDLTSPESRRSEHERKVGYVKYWRRMEIDTTFSVTHPVVHVVHGRQNVFVRQNHAFRVSRGSASVEQSKDGFRIVNRLRRRVVVNLEWILVEYELVSQFCCRPGQ